MTRLLLLVPVALYCLSFTDAAFAQAREKVRLRLGVIANSARSISSLGLYIAQGRGFLAREAIEVQVVPLRGGQNQVEELDKGTVDLSHTATPYLFDAVLKGSDSVAIVGGLANPIYSLIAKPDIKSYADLSGRTVGLSQPVDTISIASQMLLAKHDIKEPGFRLKEIGGTPARAACLTKGECDAVPLGQPDDVLFRQKGYTKLGDSLEVIPLLQFNVIAVRRAWAAANKDKVTRFARAFGNAYRFIADKSNRAEVVNTIVETTGAPPDVARTILEFYYQPGRSVMPKQAEINMAGLTAVINLVGSTGAFKPPLPSADRFVDLQYLKAAGLQ